MFQTFLIIIMNDRILFMSKRLCRISLFAFGGFQLPRVSVADRITGGSVRPHEY